MMKKYTKIGLGLASIILFISGCATKKDPIPQKNLDTKYIEKFVVKHPLYLKYNIVKDDFDSYYIDDLNTTGVRLDNLDIILNKKDYNSSYGAWYFGTSKEYNCKKTRLGYEDWGEGWKKPTNRIVAFTLMTVLAPFELGIPIFEGYPHDDECIIDKDKFANYFYTWAINKKLDNKYRKTLLSAYNKQYNLITLIKQNDATISHLLNYNDDDNNKIDKPIVKCGVDSCLERLNKYNIKLTKKNKYKLELIDLLEKNRPYTFDNLYDISIKTKDSYYKNILTIKTKDLLNTFLKTSNKLELENYLKEHPTSHYKKNISDKIYSIKKKQAMQEIRDNYFFNKWDKLYWNGHTNKDGWPDGKGQFYIENYLNKNAFLGAPRITAKITVNTIIRNHTITDGKVSSHLEKHTLFGMNDDSTHTYSKKFHGVQEMNNAIIDSLNHAIREWNGKVMQKRHFHRSKCNVIYKQCMSSCNKKSSKGFFNDRDSCQNACRGGKSACERGEYTLGEMMSCRGICKGVSASDGDLFGWGASSFDKCVDSCTDRIGN